MNYPSRITIIGNACAGKTQLALKLSKLHKIPVTHVDSIQFMEGLKFRPFKESIQLLREIQNQPAWIIDGFGPLDILEERLKLADQVFMIDLPLKVHYWWAIKRVWKNFFFKQRPELPPNSSERNISHMLKLFKTINQIHTKMRPEMLRILARDEFKNKTIVVKSISELNLLIKG